MKQVHFRVDTMASSEQRCLRFFVLACCFSTLVGGLGCATNNWSKPLFANQDLAGVRQSALDRSSDTSATNRAPDEEESLPRQTLRQQWNSFWNAGFGASAGLDPVARDIERSLGY